MSYNLSKFPSDVTKLFEPNSALQFKRPTDYPLSQRQTNPNISGLSSYLRSEAFTDYLKDFPKGTPNRHLNRYTKVKKANTKNHIFIQDEFRKWDPENDQNMANTDPYKTIFVGRLPYEVTEVELQKIFSKFGEIEKIRAVRDQNSKSRGYGFITYIDGNCAKVATREIGVHRGIEINGRKCIVDIERGRSVKYFKPRRLGGGLGGRGYTNFHTGPLEGSRPRFDSDSSRGRPYRDRYDSGTPATRYTAPTNSSRSATMGHPHLETGSRYSSTTRAEPTPTHTSQVSYKSRTTRSRDTDTDSKPEMPDY